MGDAFIPEGSVGAAAGLLELVHALFFGSSPGRQLRVSQAFIPRGNVGAEVVLFNAVQYLNGGLPII